MGLEFILLSFATRKMNELKKQWLLDVGSWWFRNMMSEDTG